MDANKFFIRKDGFTAKQVNIPIQLEWDYLGLDQSVDLYEKEVITEVIGVGRDFEVSRFAHLPATATTNNTEINYEFYFYSGGSLTDINNWKINYLGEGFTPQELYYYQNNFSNEDLYTAFLGLTPEGGLFPFPNITGSLPTPSGYEYINTKVSASNELFTLVNSILSAIFIPS